MKSEITGSDKQIKWSHPVRGAWIEMVVSAASVVVSFGSHPVRGAWIEMPISSHLLRASLSHPVRGAWIEIRKSFRTTADFTSRTPSGVRGLKFGSVVGDVVDVSRTPSGVRGLKFELFAELGQLARSHPVRGAWIEIH